MKKWEKREKPLKTFDELYEEYFEKDESETMNKADNICNDFNNFLLKMDEKSRKKWLNEHNLPVKESDQQPVNDMSIKDYLVLISKEIQSLTNEVEKLKEEIKDIDLANIKTSAWYEEKLDDVTARVAWLESFTGSPTENERFD
jgi:hypothetical protein